MQKKAATAGRDRARELLKHALSILDEAITTAGCLDVETNDDVTRANGALLSLDIFNQANIVRQSFRELGRECGPDVAGFKASVAIFESSYPLAELHAITDIRVRHLELLRKRGETYIIGSDIKKMAELDPLREPARVALIRIVDMLNRIRDETNITPEQLKELEAKYKILSRAVGIVNKDNIVDHTR